MSTRKLKRGEKLVPTTEFRSAAEAKLHADCAMGRILRLGSRPTRPGDLKQLELCVEIIKAANAYLGPL